MADKKFRTPKCIPGKFYVDDQCIACDACVVEAPLFFEMDDIEGHAFVKKQPSSKSELEDCIRALETCPVEAIGSDGES